MSRFGTALSNGTAEEEAYRHVLAGIRTGRFKAGDRLIPEELAGEIGMSRMPVREAFRRLATEGLVVLRPNRGCMVAGLTVEEMYEVFEIRSVLEGLAVRLAMPRLDAEAFDELERLLERMVRSGTAGGGWVSRHRELHEYICGFSHRPKLIRQIAALHITIEPYLRIWFDHAEKPLSAEAEHRAIIDALKTGDTAHAERQMAEHILTTAPDLAAFAFGGGRPA
ncbi:MAG: transcriptional regulator [Xanthobacteraceae bacterium]|jgi:DNA-binding GntR family transcriptional regulator|nr:transcriptional regulator [Xanthobacteraceae bacterium]